MSKEVTYAGKRGAWRQRLNTVAANAGDLEHLQGLANRLEATLQAVEGVARQQAIFIAGKQESSQQLAALMGDGERLDTLLRKGLQQHYGIGSEKLAEFGVQPYRGRTRKAVLPVEDTSPPSADPAE
ncbi:MAG TPA: hypothetical protein VEL74_11880 [Thermoanaerobaculia bacterium]|nr:hypothetical protein [Thermoanaerobaculia bacterium]